MRVRRFRRVRHGLLRAQKRAARVDLVHEVEALDRCDELPVRPIADALLTRTSMPPKQATAAAIDRRDLASSRISIGDSERPAAGLSISAAAV